MPVRRHPVPDDEGFFLEQSGNNAEGFIAHAPWPATRQSLRLSCRRPRLHLAWRLPRGAGDFRTRRIARTLSAYPLAFRRASDPGYEQFTGLLGAHVASALPLFERIELLWRLEVLRHLPVDMTTWKDLAEQGERLLAHQETALTIWMHHWIGLALARAGDVGKARRQIAYLQQLPQGQASGHWSTLGPTCSKASWRSCGVITPLRSA